MRKIKDESIIDAVECAYEEGHTDALEGGVPAEEVHSRVGGSLSFIRKRLSALAANGPLKEVTGVPQAMVEKNGNNKGLGPRRSYLPDS